MGATPHSQPIRNSSSSATPALPYNGPDGIPQDPKYAMTDEAKQWAGQIVDGKFHLQQFLGGSSHSAVFLTERAEEPKKAAIKLLQVAPEDAERQLFQWRVATKLPHPNLLRIFESGRCEIGGRSLLFVVTEYAEENLAEVLGQRALNPDETRDLLKPLLEALGYLHGKGFVHGDLRPANILASGDLLKLSTDSISTAGASQPRADGYTAPEQQQGQSTAASDIWSLGVVLMEALTGRAPSLEPGKDPGIPKEVPEPFADIARHCLRLDPFARWSVADIKNRLDPKPAPIVARPAPVRKPAPSKWLYILPSIVLVLALIALLWPKGRQQETRPSEPARQRAVPKSNPTTPSAAPSPAPKAAARQSARTPGAVANRVLPQVPQTALETITGRLRVAVRANVDESGNVTSTTLQHAGPSKYFARLALQAAQDWKFTPPQAASGPQPSAWILHFTFTSRGVDASASPAR